MVDHQNTNVVIAINAASALITLVINSLVAVQQYQKLISKSRAEGRDITDEELAVLKSNSDVFTAEVLALLKPQA